jgi:hypothetical protein
VGNWVEFHTFLFAHGGATAEALTKFADTIAQKVLLKRYGQPGEVGKLVSFLSSEEASFITGGDYVIDGGMSITLVNQSLLPRRVLTYAPSDYTRSGNEIRQLAGRSSKQAKRKKLIINYEGILFRTS